MGLPRCPAAEYGGAMHEVPAPTKMAPTPQHVHTHPTAWPPSHPILLTERDDENKNKNNQIILHTQFHPEGLFPNITNEMCLVCITLHWRRLRTWLREEIVT